MNPPDYRGYPGPGYAGPGRAGNAGGYAGGYAGYADCAGCAGYADFLDVAVYHDTPHANHAGSAPALVDDKAERLAPARPYSELRAEALHVTEIDPVMHVEIGTVADTDAFDPRALDDALIDALERHPCVARLLADCRSYAAAGTFERCLLAAQGATISLGQSEAVPHDCRRLLLRLFVERVRLPALAALLAGPRPYMPLFVAPFAPPLRMLYCDIRHALRSDDEARCAESDAWISPHFAPEPRVQLRVRVVEGVRLACTLSVAHDVVRRGTRRYWEEMRRRVVEVVVCRLRKEYMRRRNRGWTRASSIGTSWPVSAATDIDLCMGLAGDDGVASEVFVALIAFACTPSDALFENKEEDGPESGSPLARRAVRKHAALLLRLLAKKLDMACALVELIECLDTEDALAVLRQFALGDAEAYAGPVVAVPVDDGGYNGFW
jgi:hypothetical protein